MGTNYYLFTKKKKTMQDIFGEWGDFGLTDNPEFGYERHIGKTSCGWKPLLQISNAFKTFKELKEIYLKHDDLQIIDEYGCLYELDEFEDMLINHSIRDKIPLKWVEEENEFDPQRRMILTTVECSEKEAELHVPIDHLEYFETEKKARIKYHHYERDYFQDIKYWRDPDYNFDWTEGEFS